MKKINKPNKRTFWKTVIDGKTIIGFTDKNQITECKSNFEYNKDASKLFDRLPNKGNELKKDEYYSFGKDLVQVIKKHERTNKHPKFETDKFIIFEHED